MSDEERVGIIGAGASGLGAAWALAQEGIPAAIFEKSRGVSGRAATRGRHGVRFDHGANFFRLDDSEVRHLVQEVLPTDDLVEIPGEVWTFDRAGRIERGDPEQNSEAKWTYREGISTLGKLLLAATSGAELHRETRITRIERMNDRWMVVDEAGESYGPFPALLLALPGPQAGELLGASGLSEELADALGAAGFHPQFSFVLGYDDVLPRPEPFHALVNSDREHDVAWLSFEDDKPGHVPDGQSVLVVQMSPDWSAGHFETPPEELLPMVVEAAGSLLPGGLPEPIWWNSQRWRLAHPTGAVDREQARSAEADGLYLAGDGLVGMGRVPLALKTGLEVAKRIAKRVRETT